MNIHINPLRFLYAPKSCSIIGVYLQTDCNRFISKILSAVKCIWSYIGVDQSWKRRLRRDYLIVQTQEVLVRVLLSRLQDLSARLVTSPDVRKWKCSGGADGARVHDRSTPLGRSSRLNADVSYTGPASSDSSGTCHWPRGRNRMTRPRRVKANVFIWPIDYYV